ncbi:hypothetical protein BU24DRAFT_24355 [Aaosphaeria arxii CBS 175.79]|uniref:RWD domain-containing protein n=1 Tax=Aaosphaeria arxii CBS 175.79 TaxID=1450172 RepID=A0A6A5YA00_9PLEO|nr:uncharacterized protein BU24DRAFT_24355 [Aaosphaeria arxii CBS 175.79]KAF2021630.1 hypothetical protein BU24DRAFT_24355 [Aaosphaeria arxii CBS 175.79]
MSSPDSRLSMELELLEAMYPSQTVFDSRSRDFKYTDSSSLLHLRLPEHYPSEGFPEVISANDNLKSDIRDRTKAALGGISMTEGEESLDAIISCFHNIISSAAETNPLLRVDTIASGHHPAPALMQETNKTTIIWLHHLLALTKRKLALSPTDTVAGITKPGYPGIMVFSGPTTAVDDHVNTLKKENWQAFQVRYERDVTWNFGHGRGVVEVETMSEVVKDLEAGPGPEGSQQKEEFLRAVGIK